MQPLTGLAQWSVGSIDGDGIRYGFATSAWKISTPTTASESVSAQSISVRSGAGRRDPDLSRIRTVKACQTSPRIADPRLRQEHPPPLR